MSEPGLKRKLTALLSADVVGYSRLMRDDEEGTVRALAANRALIQDIVARCGGSVIDSPGDNLLAAFASVVDAVQSAVRIQEQLQSRNADIAAKRRMAFRVGVNLGDVIEQDGRIYGDGVNIAARVQGLADPGGIAISGTVYEHIQNKLALGYHFLGEKKVKNISEPIAVYRVLPDGEAGGPVIDAKRSRSSRKRWLAAMAAVVTIAGGAAGIRLYLSPSVHPEQKAAVSEEGLPAFKQAAIAVLPFDNLSQDPAQAYFSDGITNDLITALSRFKKLLVIASTTTFTYKDKSVNIEQVGRELGVRYVLEGSVQKAAEQVRVNAQLIDAVSGYHIWSERYDRRLEEIFAVQDDIVRSIVGKLAVKIDDAERKRARREKTGSLQAYDYYLRGMDSERHRTTDGNRNARALFETAIELDPEFAPAYVGLGQTYLNQVSLGWTEFPQKALEQVEQLAGKALRLEESNADAYALLGMVNIYRQRYDRAVNQLDRAIELNPNNATALKDRGMVMVWIGQLDDAVQSLETAFRFNPNQSPGGFVSLGQAYYLKGQYLEAIQVFEESASRWPDWLGSHLVLAAAYAQAGRTGEAAREAEEIRRLDPFFTIDDFGTAFRNPADRDQIVEGLRKAGLK
ncbi:MAG TPA: adenylate/guanylate cyclase domain-containing protein [Desulfobacterales bacterium]